MRPDADNFTVARHFEAYLLWLFGWVMFCSSQGDSCPKQLIPLARSIADAPLHEMPQFSCGSAVLAASYRGLCTGVTKVSAEEPIFVGCPLLLQLWSYECFPIGRPEMDFEPYVQLSADHDDVDRPTMGSLWCLRRVRYIICFTYCYMPAQMYDLAVNLFFHYAAFLGRRADEEVVPLLHGTV